MVNVIKQEVRMEEHLRKRLEFICEFCRVKPIIINGNLRTIDKTNLTYLEPHRIIINNNTFLVFNYSNDIFIENLKQADKNSSELKQNSKDIKEKIDKLKVTKLNKDNYILSKEDKETFVDFINQVNDTSKEYDKIQTLSNTLVNAHEQLKNKNNKIKTLTENNEALDLRVKTLNDTIKEKDNEISFLKSKIHDLKNTLEYWKNKFEKLISFLHDKLHSWYDKDDKYIDVVNEMYDDNVLDDDDIEELNLNKEKDDFER